MMEARQKVARVVRADGRPPFHGIPLGPAWQDRLGYLDVTLSPLVSARTGRCVGYEARPQGMEVAGFPTASALQDAAFSDGVLTEVEAAWWAIALHRFVSLTAPGGDALKLFLSTDGRALRHTQRLAGYLSSLVRAAGIPPAGIVLGVTEHHGQILDDAAVRNLPALRAEAGRLMLNHFGAGTAGLPLLYAAQPNYVRLDRFFLADVAADARKKVLLRHMVNLAHLLGAEVIAPAVDSDRDFLICKDVGVDVVQGALLEGPPSLAGASVQALLNADRRQSETDIDLIRSNISQLEPVLDTDPPLRVFERFYADQSLTFVPVVTADGCPAGIVREKDIKAYAYSPFGRDLLNNKSCSNSLERFLWRCPVADINSPAERILEVFSADDNSDGILITNAGRYTGFLSARSLLRILNEKNLALARDQNPLTKLPGNAMINAYLATVLADRDSLVIIAYLDFDNFKPFNDSYGFRQGDRAITLFADILRQDISNGPHAAQCFIAHVGGDDFFAGFRDLPFDAVEATVRRVVERFRREVESFYEDSVRQAGYVVATLRDGSQGHIPLLTASAALVEVPKGHAPGDLDDLSAVIAATKKEAKKSPSKLASITALAPEAAR